MMGEASETALEELTHQLDDIELVLADELGLYTVHEQALVSDLGEYAIVVMEGSDLVLEAVDRATGGSVGRGAVLPDCFTVDVWRSGELRLGLTVEEPDMVCELVDLFTAQLRAGWRP